MPPSDDSGVGVYAERDALSIYAALLRGELEGDEALRASQQVFRLVTDTIPQAVWWKDRDCVFLGCNRYLADLVGLTPEDFIGKTDREMPWGSDQPYGADWYQAHDRRVMESGRPEYGIREQLLKPDGSKVWIQTNKVPLRDFDGNVIGVLGTFEDITDRLRAEEERKRTLDELDERVQARTAALRKANEALRRQVEERIRLEAQERRHRGYAEALRDTAAGVARSLDLDDTMEQVLVGVERLVPNHLGAVVLIDPDETLRLAHVHQRATNPSGTAPGEPIEGVAFLDRLSRSDDPVIDNDVRGSGLGSGSRSVLGTPIAVSDTRLGYLVVESTSPGYFGHDHAERLRAVADLAAAAISNAQRFSAAAELATLEERQRLARELHDAVSQTLWTASLVADSMARVGPAAVTRRQLDRLQKLTRGALAEMRTLLHELRPAALADTPFTQLIDQLIDAFQSRKAVKVRLSAPPASEVPELSAPRKFALYRIVQEALNNVGRHSGASEVTVDVSTDEKRFLVSIRDDGVGFDPEDAKTDRLGLTIMRERADSVGASLRITSRPGAGCLVEIGVPLEDDG